MDADSRGRAPYMKQRVGHKLGSGATAICLAMCLFPTGCGANRPTGEVAGSRTEAPSASQVLGPTPDAQSAERSGLFAAPYGTCAVSTAGRVTCWGDVPAAFAAFAQDVGAVSLDLRSGPKVLCAIDAAHTAHCVLSKQDCFLGPCQTVIVPLDPVRNARAVWPVMHGPVVLRADGSVCVPGKPTSCAALTAVDAGGTPLPGDWDLRRAIWADDDEVAFTDHRKCKFALAPHDLPSTLSCELPAAPLEPLARLRAGDWWAFLDVEGRVWRYVEPRNRTASAPQHVVVEGFSQAHGFAASYWQLCAHRERGQTSCMSRPGVLGSDVPDSLPSAMPGLECTLELSAGHRHVCARTCAGKVLCWGDNREGQLQVGAHAPVFAHELPLTDVTQLAAGKQHTCALDTAGAVSCWGESDGLALGSTPSGMVRASPVAVNLPARAKSLSSSLRLTCALLEDGRVSCWGHRAGAIRGRAYFVEPGAPTLIAGLEQVEQVEAGDLVHCARHAGAVSCWGNNDRYDLLLGHRQQVATAVPLARLQRDVVDLSLLDSVGCALKRGGAIVCWGKNNALAKKAGWVPDPNQPMPNLLPAEPTRLWTVPDALEVELTPLGLCALRKDATVWCASEMNEILQPRFNDVARLWRSIYGALIVQHRDGRWELRGNPSWLGELLTPDVTDVAWGDKHACVLNAKRQVRCAGPNSPALLGTGALLSSIVPLEIVMP